jgi:ABC-type dipeptide/oligopeptide/nickel transport system permease subunit
MISENRGIIGQNPMAVLAPAVMLALLTVGVNLTGDAIARSLGVGSSAELELNEWRSH